jgi:ankyrin repeat protein
MKNYFLIVNLFVLLFSTISNAMENEARAITRLHDSIISTNHNQLKEVISEYPQIINSNNLLHYCSVYDFRSNLSFSPIEVAICVGNVEAIRILINGGADVKNTNGKNGVLNCFLGSDFCNNIEIYETLIKVGAQFNPRNIDNYSILHKLSRWNKSVILNYILKTDNSLNKQDSRGMTPMHHAIESSAFECIKIFLGQLNIDLLIKNNEGKNSLSFAKEQFDCYSSDLNPCRRPIITVCSKYKEIGQMLIQHLGAYSAHGRISKQGLAQILPPEIAHLIASFLFRE